MNKITVILCAISALYFTGCASNFAEAGEWRRGYCSFGTSDIASFKSGDTVDDVLKKFGSPIRPAIGIPFFYYYAADDTDRTYVLVFDYHGKKLRPTDRLIRVILTDGGATDIVVWSAEPAQLK